MNFKYFTNNFLSILLAFILLLTNGACKKFLAIPPPQNQIQTAEIFKNDQSAISAVTGLHSQLLTASFWPANGGITLFPGLSADEIYNSTSDPDIDGFTNNSLLPNNEYINSSLWSFIYKTIYQANAILVGLANSQGLSTQVKNQLKGEVLIIRAWHYFFLVNLYGEVPLVLTTNYEANQALPRTATSQIVLQITNDLVEAKSILTPSYPTSGRFRPNKWTATALLSRVYLYRKEWAKAEAEASEIINSGLYTLPSNLLNVFLPTSTETIWQLIRDNNNTAEASTFIPPSATAKPRYVLTNSLLNAFEPGDQRKVNWVNKNTVTIGSTVTDFYYPYKYKSRLSSGPAEYYIVFRISEQFLIRSEVRAYLNDLPGSIADLNKIRNRAGLPNTLANDQSSLLAAIEAERRVELFTEWGHRWFDIKRTGRADLVLANEKGANWQPTDTLYPIPFGQIQLNQNLTQNPGY
jgi:hypothetical protein